RVLLGSADGKDKATRENVEAAFAELLKGVTKKDTVLLGFSGHGHQLSVEVPGPDGKKESKEVPFFCPVDAVPTKDGANTLISISAVIKTLDDKGGGHNLLLVDACRDLVDPNKGKRGGIDSSRVENLGEGTAVFLACASRQKARETDQMFADAERKEGKGHGVFFHFVIEGLKGDAKNESGDVTWERLVPYVKGKVKAEFPKWFDGLTDDERQRPQSLGNLTDDPVLVAAAGDGKTHVSKATGMKFVRIKAGTFQMGSPKEEKDRSDDEAQHEVTLTKDYFLGVYEVTRGQFKAFVDDTGYKTEGEADGTGGYGWDAAKKDWVKDAKYTWRNPGFAQTDEHPVVLVSWNDAVKFCEWLSKKDGRAYQLPSEAQWEFACRAGAKTRFHFGDDDEDLAKYGNVADKDFRAATGKDWGIKGSDGYGFTAPVGKFKPNVFGLYDMHGNAWEWCRDYYGSYDKVEGKRDPVQLNKQSSDRRVLRGGCWIGFAGYCRAARRLSLAPDDRSSSIGFRVCLPLD
ncbi:MAG: formylglycine-generating enzyme family protein, partial [Gemmataceae bacterium]|nr:formylglycine-generating enzyme family protein [Gemmataceae bacterium]